MSEHPLVREATRRIVGRVALQRASKIVQGWRQEEEDNRRLLPRVASALLVFAVLAVSALYLLRQF